MARRPGLGRGLDALIPISDQNTQPFISDKDILQIPIEKISPNPQQPRGTSNLADLEDLAASILEHGIIQPIIVTQAGNTDTFTLVAGERRWRASQLAGLKTVPAIVRTATQQEQLELALIENIQREDLNPLERAEAYQHLINDFSLSHEEVAKRVGKSRVSITNTLRL
ncbi:MAG: ParB/RepB/Spo0J family partition protein, partial [Chloroflexota bacterium]